MADNLKLKKPQDASKINLGQKYEIDYWTKTLNISELKLFFAVLKVGNSVDDVKEFLRNQ